MKYRLVDFEGREKAELETEYSVPQLLPLLKQALVEQYLDYDVIERNSGHKFYLYRYRDGDFKQVEFIGVLETKRDWRDTYDYLVAVLGAIFIRRQKI